MEQVPHYGDPRLLLHCVYCGGGTATRDHVPSRILLDEPYPENLPVVLACSECNSGFSLDEEYFACFVDMYHEAIAPEQHVPRPKIARILRDKPLLKDMLERSRCEVGGSISFAIDTQRVRNVLLKLARGHAAFDLDEHLKEESATVALFPLADLDPATRECFETAPAVVVFPEVGSRAMQRMSVVSVTLESVAEPSRVLEQQVLLEPSWMEVQPGRYRYLATAPEPGSVIVRMVLSEVVGCEAVWS